MSNSFIKMSESMANSNAKDHFSILIKNLKLSTQVFEYFNNNHFTYYAF